MARPVRRFTVFDALEQKGVFSSNPANPASFDPVEGTSLYKGPVQYPKMLYHPKGEEEIVTPPEVIATPLGAKEVGEKRRIVTITVNDQDEEAKMLAAGWHDHPAKAIAASGKTPPPMGSSGRIRDLESEIEKLNAQIKQQQEGMALKAVSTPPNTSAVKAAASPAAKA